MISPTNNGFQSPSRRLTNLLGDLVESSLRPRDEYDVEAATGQLMSELLADSGGAAGDDCRFGSRVIQERLVV
jgi:hypothetical protein